MFSLHQFVVVYFKYIIYVPQVAYYFCFKIMWYTHRVLRIVKIFRKELRRWGPNAIVPCCL
jgi:hypothetical protein